MNDPRGGLSRLIKDALAVGAAAAELITDRLPRARKAVVLYDGFGAGERALIQGRALHDEGILAASPDDSRLSNLAAMLRRADADPLPHAVIDVGIGAAAQQFVADNEGFFAGWMPAVNAERIDDEWVRVRGEMPGGDGAPVRAVGRLLMPVHTPAMLVISDIDDTVLQSKVTNLLRAVQTIAFGNARTRLPFPGVAAFYQALRGGPTGTARNPLFYVSSSPWNLYDVIQQFLEIQNIPAGPIMLRDLDIGLDTLSARHHHAHKREMIRRVMTAFPSTPAILIGDSAQQDPEIYRDVVREHGKRVQAVYIRNVTMDADRSRAIQGLAEEIVAAGSSLLLADDTLAAARHAADHGFISPDALGSIGEEKKADEGVTGEKKDAPGARDASDAPTPTIVVEKNSRPT